MERQERVLKNKKTAKKLITKYIVSLIRDDPLDDKIHLDVFAPISMPIWPEGDGTAFKVARMLEPKLGSEQASTLAAIAMRMRYSNNSIGPLLIHWTSEGELTKEMLESYVNALSKEDLKAFVNAAKFRF